MSGRPGRRRWRILWAIPLAIVLVFAALILLAPQFANLESARNKLSQLLEERVGVRIQFGRMDLSYLPVPHLRVLGVSVALPGGEEGNADVINIFPRLFPLLQGKVRISRVEVDSLRMKILLPQAQGEVRASEVLRLFLAPLALQEPDLRIVLREGSVEVHREGTPSLLFSEVAAEVTLPPEGFSLRISCASNLWEEAVLEGRLDVQVLKGEGNLNLKGFQPGPLLDSLTASSEIRLAESLLDLGFSFRMEGLQEVQAELQGTFPEMTLVRAEKRAELKSGRFSATAALGGEGVSFFLKELSLEEPKMAATGELALIGEDGGIKVRLEAKDLDVSSIREKVLSLAGDDPSVSKLFGVLRAGVVPGVAFQSAAGSLSGLLDLENMVIAGRLEEGKIHVPGVELDLEEVKGEATLSEGILEGTSLEARHVNTRGEQGALKLGFRGEGSPFHLDIQVHADLSDLQPVLRRVVNHRVFRSVMEKTRELQGKASGRLVLGDRLSDIRARVEVSEFDLSARCHEIPHPVQIQGGRYFYEGTSSHGRDFQCQVGKSSVSGLSWNLDWDQELHMTLELRQGRISVEEILSWISAVDAFRGGLEGIGSWRGELLLAETRVSGPLQEPTRWRFEVNGEIPDLHGSIDSFPAPLRVTSGRFAADPEKLELKDVETRFMDTSLTVSGTLEGYLRSLQKADLNIRGEVGIQATEKFTLFSWQGKPVHVRSPLSLEPMRVTWERDRSLGFSGVAAIQDGPTITVDARREQEQWIVDRLLLKDEHSQAEFSLRLRDPEMTLSFAGTLSEKTLDRIFPGYESQYGWVRGEFQVHLARDRIQDCWARGRLAADDFSILHLLPASLDIDEISLKAEGRRVEFDILKFNWADTRFSATGSLEMKADALRADMDFHASVFDWQQVKPFLPESKQHAPDRGKRGAGVVHEGIPGIALLGSVRFHFDRFTHAGFTWSPLKAEATFDRRRVEARVTEAQVCGISTLGSFVVTQDGPIFKLEVLAARQEVLPSLECLTEGKRKGKGLFDLNLELQGKEKEGEWLSSLLGSLTFSATKGSFQDPTLLEKVTQYLSASGIPANPRESGQGEIPFESVRVKAKIQNGQCTVREAVFDGVDLEAGFEGQVDLVRKTIDGRLLVAPFRTMDRIVNFIPVVRTIMGKTLVSIPIKVSGPLDDPKVSPLAPSAVGKSLVDMMKRTFNLPVQMFDPQIHKRDKK